MQFKSERHAVPSETVMQIQSESACSSSGICKQKCFTTLQEPLNTYYNAILNQLRSEKICSVQIVDVN